MSYEATHPATHQHQSATGVEGAGGSGGPGSVAVGGGRAWPRYWWRRALHPLRGYAPVTWRYTRSERVQCLRIGCNAYGSGAPHNARLPQRRVCRPARITRRQEHTKPQEPQAPPVRRAPEGPQGQAAAPAGGDNTAASQISHVIYRGHFSRCPKNVAIPTMPIQYLNQSERNYVRNY